MKKRKLTSQELEKLKTLFNLLESDALFSIGANHISDSFASAEIYNYDNEIIDVELKFGIQSDTENTVYSENMKIDRNKIQVIN